MKPSIVLVVSLPGILLPTGGVRAEVWDVATDFSIRQNPNGAWSYCGKPAIAGTQAFLLTYVYDGWIWFPGNVGHGAPAVGSGPVMWAKNNSNGYPAVRWTSPADGWYDIQGSFSGADGRGVDNLVYVVINGSVEFSGHIASSSESAPFLLDDIHLSQGDVVDFALEWNGGVYSEYGWTQVAAVIVPEPGACAYFGSMLLLRMARRRRRRLATTR